MRTKHSFLFLVLALFAGVHHAAAQSTAFTYQGRLNSGTNPANGSYDLSFALYNAVTNGSQVGTTLTNSATAVGNGLFAVTLDFGAGVFTGTNLWLDISVRTNGGASFAELTPRQPLTPTPYAIFANTAGNFSGSIPLAQLPGGVVTNNETGVTLNNLTVGGNLNLPTYTALIYSGATPILYSYENTSFFAGYGAGALNNNGVFNVGVGFQALHTLANGNWNTAIGYDALYLNTSGSGNEANGFEAMYNTTGSDNVANGYATLSFTSGNNNVANGYQALTINTTGSANTANGYETLFHNTGGSNNTANGYQAIYQSAGGSYNTADGYETLYDFLSGNNNIALGAFAGDNLSIGSSNIYIGNQGGGSDNNTIRIGTSQTQTFIAGVINGNGAGLTNLNLSQLSSTGGNFFAGPNAGNSTLTGVFNTAMGVSALSADTSGSANSAFGNTALNQNLTGTGNSAFGYAALFSNNSGSNNVATGENALNANTTGSDNTAAGYLALNANQTGRRNIANGAQSLYSSTNGSFNVAVGYDAMKLNLNDSAEVAVGYGALESATAGGITVSGNGENTAIGYQALLQDTVGVGNTALGYQTLLAIVNGAQNTAIGDSALLSNISGNNNIGIGYNAGHNVVSGDNSIFIGNGGVDGDVGVIRIGDTNLQFLTYIAGTVQHLVCSSITIVGGADLAEPFPISSADQAVTEGAVMVIDEANPGHLKMSNQPYDSRVAGVVSGANGINPGIQMEQQGLLEGGKNVALTGRVYVQADASNGPIQPGDLLTTSSIPGRAMKVSDHAKAQGAILGKAMTGLKDGQGMVLVLVTLQ
jgi:hypothetical protein